MMTLVIIFLAIILIMDLNQQNLFSILQIGDRQVQRLKSNVYMIVGLTKNGKSCFFNHLLAKPMVGVPDPEDPQRVIYAPQPRSPTAISEYAVMGSAPVSITLAPNIAELPGQVSVIDMLGFQQNRNEKSALSVSYFLSSCFERASTVRFIVVIASQNLMCQNLDFICGSFNELIEMFALPKFGERLKKNFLDSISVVVSSATHNNDHYKTRLSTILNKLADTRLETIKNRELIVEMLKRVVATARVQSFPQARLGESNGPCNVLQRLEEKGWKEFEVRRAKQVIGEDAIIIPFREEFSKLRPVFVGKFKDSLQAKFASLIEISELFGHYLAALTQNWEAGSIHQLDMSSFSTAMRRCLKQALRYHKDALSQRQIHIPSNHQQHIFAIVRKSLKIYELHGQLEHQWQSRQLENKLSFDRSMSMMEQIYSEMVECLVPAFTQQQDLRTLAEIKFTLVRSFREFTKFNQLDPDLLSNSNIMLKMKDAIASHLTSPTQHLATFTHRLTRALLHTHFRTLDHLQEYQQLLLQYQLIAATAGQADQLFQIKILRMNCCAEQLKADILLASTRNWDALKAHLQLIQLKTQLFILTASPKLLWSSQKRPQDLANQYSRKPTQPSSAPPTLKLIQANRAEKLEQAYYQVAKEITCFANTLLRQDYVQVGRFIWDLLRLCELARTPSLADRIYQTMFEQESSSRVKILGEQAAHCRKWGWLEKAHLLLNAQKQLQMQQPELDLPKIKQINAQLVSVAAQVEPERVLSEKQAETVLEIVGVLRAGLADLC